MNDLNRWDVERMIEDKVASVRRFLENEISVLREQVEELKETVCVLQREVYNIDPGDE